jgi:hypothetical protein
MSLEADGYVHSSRVWTALGWMALDANFWPANLGASAIAVGGVCARGRVNRRMSEVRFESTGLIKKSKKLQVLLQKS